MTLHLRSVIVPFLLAGTLTLTFISPASAVTPPATAAGPTATAGAAADGTTSGATAAAGTTADSTASMQDVSFAGVTVQAPASWPVINVDDAPGCVRYDDHAVFLGSPSESDCPARLVGRTSTVQILRAGQGPVDGGSEPATLATHSDGGEVVVTEDGQPRVVVTTDPDHSSLVASMVASVTIDGAPIEFRADTLTKTPEMAPLIIQPRGSPPLDASSPDASPTDTGYATTDAPRAPKRDPLIYTGTGFDACTAPTLDTMRTWMKTSPYKAIGVYVGGMSRSCDQPHLTPEWVTAVHEMGWRLIPIYVGRQAECAKYKKDGKYRKFPHRINAKKASAQGETAALDAIAQMNARGLGPGNPIYYDMEAWNHHNEKCTGSVLEYMDTWNLELHKAGYLSGFYSSVGNGMPAIVDAHENDPAFHEPDAIWLARWDEKPNTNSEPYFSNSVWSDHQRIKQYRGGHHETWGGVTINVDSNYVDGPVTGTVLDMTPGSLPMATSGAKYSAALKGSGGIGKYAFREAVGTLPDGLRLSSAGIISGQSTQAGHESKVTIGVRDHNGGAGSRVYRIYTTFSDMPTNQLFFGPVTWLARSYITFGYDDGTFRPAGTVSRGQMAAFLFRAANPGIPAPKCKSKPFPDVATDYLFCGHIAWLKTTGITKPADGKYHASAPVSRGSMTALLFRLTHPHVPSPRCSADKQFPDVSTDNVFCGYIQWAAKNGIAYGYDDGKYRATNDVTRGAMAAFLSRIDTLR